MGRDLAKSLYTAINGLTLCSTPPPHLEMGDYLSLWEEKGWAPSAVVDSLTSLA